MTSPAPRQGEEVARLSFRGTLITEVEASKIASRMSEKTQVDPNSGCFLWEGSMCRGYGNFRFGKGNFGAHRISWMMANGREPATGMSILHSCDTPLCINPMHLREGTQAQNMKEAAQRNRIGPNIGYRRVGAADRQMILSLGHLSARKASVVCGFSERTVRRVRLESENRTALSQYRQTKEDPA